MPGNGKSLLRSSLLRPSVLEDIIRPWNEWLDEKWPFSTHLPAVNVKETDDTYEIIMAARAHWFEEEDAVAADDSQ